MVNFKSPLPTPWILGAFLLETVYLDLAKGQTTDAVCNGTNWTWTLNSKKQSPCLVAAYLLAPCGGGQYNVPAILPNQHYNPPNENNANSCLCSSVVYSLLSACGVCQVDKPIAEANPSPKWSLWRTDCPSSMVSISEYPNNISPATAVPAWAYLDIVTTDMFDPVSATQDVNLPESTVGNITPSSTSSPISTTPDNNSSGVSMITIIGVTVGGIIGLFLTTVLIVYIVKKRKGQLTSARASAAPSMAAAAGLSSASQHPNTLLSGGYSSSNQGQSEPPLPSPWSPPPPSSTPARTISPISPMSAQSLLSTHNYGSPWGRGDDGIDYRHSLSVPGTVDSSENPGSTMSMGSTVPLMQYAGTRVPPLDTSMHGPYATTRPVQPYGAGNGQGGSGPSLSRLSRLPPEI